MSMSSFESSLNELAERITQSQMSVQTEEAAKQAFVLPFIRSLGYDIFNPKEVVPEFIADIGTKRGEKVDYAVISSDGKPFIIIECKGVNGTLGRVSETQLYRYFNATLARVGILTNGVIYRFYSDLEKKNVMDDTPFYEADLSSIIDQDVNFLTLFRKGDFDEAVVLREAERMKYVIKLRQVISKQFFDPDDDLVRWFTKKVYIGSYTTRVKDHFTQLVIHCLNEEVSSRVKRVIERSLTETSTQEPVEEESAIEKTVAIETTVQELEGLVAIRALTHDIISSTRVGIRDRKNYCAVIVDDNQRKPVTRMYFNDPKNLRLRFYTDGKWGPTVPLDSLDNIHDHAATFREIAGAIVDRDATDSRSQTG